MVITRFPDFKKRHNRISDSWFLLSLEKRLYNVNSSSSISLRVSFSIMLAFCLNTQVHLHEEYLLLSAYIFKCEVINAS